VFWLLSRLPIDVGLALGRGIGNTLYWVIPKRRKATLTNLELAFPEQSSDAHTQCARAVYQHVGMTIAETAWIWFRNTDNLNERFSVSGVEHLETAMESNNGLILLQAHFSALEITGSYLGPRWPIGAVFDPPKNPMAAAWLLAQRERRITPMIDNKNIRTMIRELKNGQSVWYSPDQCVSSAQGGIPTRYFDQPVLTSNGTARMVKMTKAIVIPMIPTRHDNGKRYHIAFHKPIEFSHDEEVEQTQAINDLFEQQVRRYPEQYLWLHKRFKPPPGNPNPYA